MRLSDRIVLLLIVLIRGYAMKLCFCYLLINCTHCMQKNGGLLRLQKCVFSNRSQVFCTFRLLHSLSFFQAHLITRNADNPLCPYDNYHGIYFR